MQRSPAAVLAALALLQPLDAVAYIDPNTGGLLFQLLAPLLAMIASAWLLARDYIKGLWRRVWHRTPQVPAPAPDSESQPQQHKND